jgi:hypothetical protein
MLPHLRLPAYIVGISILGYLAAPIVPLAWAPPPPGGLDGDYNGDGKCDVADYIIWRRSDGSPAGYDLWRMNFDRTSGTGAGNVEAASQAITTPEPSTFILWTLALAALASARRMCPSSQ